jgi:hypothetical protein
LAQESKLTKSLRLGVLLCVLVVVTACTGSLPGGKSGVVAMMPFTDREQGIRGNAPLSGWADRVALNQESFSGTLEEWVATAVEKTDIVSLPRSVGTYEGSFLTWDLYTFSTRIEGAGPDIYRVDVGLAQNKARSKVYMVLLVTAPVDYAANQAMYRTVFEHALYAFEPLE